MPAQAGKTTKKRRLATSTAPRKRRTKQAQLTDTQPDDHIIESSGPLAPDTDPDTWTLPSSPLRPMPGYAPAATAEAGQPVASQASQSVTRIASPADGPVKPRVVAGLPASPLGIFEMLLPSELVAQWATWTNYRARQNSKQGTHWVPTNGSEVYLFLGIGLYMGLVKAPTTQSYWETGPHSTQHPFRQYMSRQRFELLYRWVSTWDPSIGTKCPFERVESWSLVLQARSMDSWIPGSEVSVDEAMVRFAGRCTHKVHIPRKPIPIGMKVWCIAQAGFMIGWFWHSRGNGPLGCLQSMPAALHPLYKGLAPTQAVVFALLLKLPRLPPSLYGFYVFMDNLFSIA